MPAPFSPFPLSQPASPLSPHRAEAIGRLDLYVAAAAANASDRNDGSLEYPLATFGELLRRLEYLCRSAAGAPVVVHMGSGTYAWTRTLQDLRLRAPFVIIGDGAGQPGDDGFVDVLGSTAAAVGSSANGVAAAGLTIDDLVDYSIVIESGAAAGDRRSIARNSATLIMPASPFSAAVAAGDLYRVVRSGVIVTAPVPVGGGVLGWSPVAISGVGSPELVNPGASGNGVIAPNPAALFLVNLTIDNPGTVDGNGSRFQIIDSAVTLAGVRFDGAAASGLFRVAADGASQVMAGLDSYSTVPLFRVLADLGIAPNPTAWAGWGVAAVGTGTATNVSFEPAFFAGFLNVYATAATTGASPLNGIHWLLFGGSMRAVTVGSNQNGSFSIRDQSLLIARPNVNTPLRIAGLAGSTRAAALRVQGGSRAGFLNTTFQFTANGSVIAACNTETGAGPLLDGGIVALVSGIVFEIDANVRNCVVAQGGGKVYWDSLPTVTGGPPTVAQATITQSSTGGAAVVSTTFAGLADGAVAVNPDGSGTILGRLQ